MRAARVVLVLLVASFNLMLAAPLPAHAQLPDPASYAERYNALQVQIGAADVQAADAANRRATLTGKATRLRVKIDRYVSALYRDVRLPDLLPDAKADDSGARYFAAAVDEKDETIDRYQRVEQQLAAVEVQAQDAARMSRAAQAEIVVVKAWLDAHPATAQDARDNAAALPDVPAPNPGAEIARTYAAAQLGKSYRYGTAGPTMFDCSGLTMMAWAAAGVPLPHYSGAQWQQTARITRDDLLVGDLVFLGRGGSQHVALYVGAGMVISAPHRGAVVRVQPNYDRPSGYGRVRQVLPVPIPTPPTVTLPTPSVTVPALPVP